MTQQSKKKKILIIKLGSLGDVCLATSLLKAFEDDEITWMTSSLFHPLLCCIKEISHLISLSHHDLLYGSLAKKLLTVIKAWFKIGGRKFDIVITAHKDPRYRLLSCLTRKKKHFFFTNRHTFPLGSTFHSQAYLDLISSKTALSYPHLVLPPSALDIHSLNLKKPVILLTVSQTPVDNKHLRHWPINYYEKLSLFLKPFAHIALIGEHQEDSFRNEDVIDYRGKTSLIELARLLSLSRGIITHDGGTLHLARLTKTPICVLFGPTSPLQFSHISSKEFSLKTKKPLKCSPCYDGKHFPACAHRSCMQHLTPEDVFDALVIEWDLSSW